MVEKTTVDITPDKSLIQKLGLTGYKTEQAISELLDNSIDARIHNKFERIDVILDFDGRAISITDDGTGMNLKDLEKGLTLAKGTKLEKNKLGHFGLGLKSACSTLGRVFSILTTTEDSDVEYFAQYDEDEWLNDNTKTWKNFEIETRKKIRPWHGTIIRISALNVALYANQTSLFKKSFGIRYAAYLKSNQVSLFVNTRECIPVEIHIQNDSKKIIKIELPSKYYLQGWIGLLEKRSIKGDYGIHLYKNKRLIKAFDKFGIRPHPEVAKIVGELDLDHVPVNFHKTGFIEDSLEYKEAINAFTKDPVVVGILRSSISKTPPMSSIQSVVNYFTDETQEGKIQPRLNAVSSKSLLQNASEFYVQNDSKEIKFVFEDKNDDELYDVEKLRNGYKITINRKSPIFNIVGNPLFLIGLIELEVKSILDEPDKYKEFLQKRNSAWGKFVKNWSLKKEKTRKKKPELLVPLQNYYLVDELINLHDYLNDKFDSSFQFTGLSTLSPYLQNAYNRMVYNLETTKGSGQLLHDLILNFTGTKFGVLINPKPSDLKAMMEFSDRLKFIVIREFSKKSSTTWAPPEKAWVDLFVEMKRGMSSITGDELAYLFDYLIEHALLEEKRIYAIANHRNILYDIEDYLGKTD